MASKNNTFETLFTSASSEENILPAVGFTKNTEFFDYKSELKNIGNYVDIRVISLSQTEPNVMLKKFPAIKVAKLNVTTNEKYDNQVVLVPEGESWKGMKDAFGNSLASCPTTEVARLIVWVYGKCCAKKGVKATYEPINKLMYIELQQNMIVAYNNLNQNAQNCHPFDPQTNLPKYDIRIHAVPYGTNRSYAMSAILMEMVNNLPQASPNFNVDTQQVLKEYAQDISSSIENVRKRMLTYPTVADFNYSLGIKNPTASSSTQVDMQSTQAEAVSSIEAILNGSI